MAANGQHRNGSADSALRWTGRVLTANDLLRSLNGHREVVLPLRTIVTPMAEEHLRGNGVRISRESAIETKSAPGRWGYAEDRPTASVRSAVQALAREGVALQELKPSDADAVCQWSRAVAECVARGDCQGGAVFCADPGLACCVANKVPGLRAVSVTSVTQAARATLTLGANLLIVEMPGRTYFEVRQILRTLCQVALPTCPPGVACTLQELDGRAHR
jgi:ribose 5-phosphate isomerase RpiB